MEWPKNLPEWDKANPEYAPKQYSPSSRPMAYPGVAIGVIVLSEEGLVLLGKRKGELGTGMYSLPGGKVDYGETPIAAALREVREETHLELKDVRFTGFVTNDYFPEQGKQYLCMYYMATVVDEGDLEVLEPTKVESWDWYYPDGLPRPMWANTGNLIATLCRGDRFENPDIGETI
jgi:8-oxo-dGTP diphosphatase